MAGEGPDNELVDRARAGEVEAFAALCDRHRDRLGRIVASVARGPDVEDLAQEAVVRAFCSLERYRGDAPFGAWLCRIALNLAHDYQRSAWRRRVTLSDCPSGAAEAAAGGESPPGAAERRELQRRVRQAVASLPAAQRVPIWLHFFDGFSVAEVARLEEVPESTVRSRLRAGLRRLSLSLEDLIAPAPEPAYHSPAGARGCEA